MNNSTKKVYLKPELMVVAIDQEVTLVMESVPIPPNESSAEITNSNTSEIFGTPDSNVGSNTIDWSKE